MWQVKDLLRTETNINEQTRDKFAFLNSCQKNRRSKKQTDKFANEVNSTGSFLSDLSVTHSEDDLLDVPQAQPTKWRKHRPSYTADNGGSFIGAKRSRISVDGKRKSNRNNNCPSTFSLVIHCLFSDQNQDMIIGANDKIVASTRVSIPQGNGPITAESIIEAIPSNNCENRSPNKQSHKKESFTPTAPHHIEANFSEVVAPEMPFKSVAGSTGRQHKFASRTFLKSDSCQHCQKK